MTDVFILTITSHCSSIFCVFVFRREFSRMRNTQVTSTKWTAFLTQRILSALHTFPKQPNHHSHQFSTVLQHCFGTFTPNMHPHLFTFPTLCGRPIDLFLVKRRIISNFPKKQKSADTPTIAHFLDILGA
jgi:hypothetical protein